VELHLFKLDHIETVPILMQVRRSVDIIEEMLADIYLISAPSVLFKKLLACPS
jgi:hypothetical protein